ncbi:MAG: FliA/WhiG family RNA polymerase sigma factor [Candidatus Cloacimonadota bacterium]|nr:MAG: FliA/WhiG family RNA polymerase sigma factor [Candidatus Cloacimonadota bacterium]
MDTQEIKLWELYKKNGRKELLEKIVVKYLNIVHYHANKLLVYTSGSIDKDDLYSAGVMGLLEAIEKFDLEKGVKFSTFSSIRIRGAIIDEIRSIDWVPRSIRQKSKKIDAATHHLFNKLERMPSDEEIAEELEISLEDYYKITDHLGPLFLASLETEIASDGDRLKIRDIVKDDSQEDFEEKLLKQRYREKIISSVSLLPDKEKLVISLYYYENLNLKEIGSVLNVTESRVSQLHSSALIKLRNFLKDFSPAGII